MTPAISPYAAANSAPSANSAAGGGWSSLGQQDFVRLMTVQMQQQDPFDPVDNKEMLAQMAQFSSLAGIDEMNSTLESIAERLDAMTFAQGAATSPEGSADDTSSNTNASS